MNTKIKYGLSAAVLALIAAGAPAPDILDQFLDEKEGNHTTAYRDGAGIWTICRGAILVDGKPVVPGMKLSKEKCDRVNAIERDKALAWVEKNISGQRHLRVFLKLALQTILYNIADYRDSNK